MTVIIRNSTVKFNGKAMNFAADLNMSLEVYNSTIIQATPTFLTTGGGASCSVKFIGSTTNATALSDNGSVVITTY